MMIRSLYRLDIRGAMGVGGYNHQIPIYMLISLNINKNKQ